MSVLKKWFWFITVFVIMFVFLVPPLITAKEIESSTLRGLLKRKSANKNVFQGRVPQSMDLPRDFHSTLASLRSTACSSIHKGQIKAYLSKDGFTKQEDSSFEVTIVCE